MLIQMLDFEQIQLLFIFFLNQIDMLLQQTLFLHYNMDFERFL